MERLQRDHGTDVSRYPRHQPPFSRASSNLGDDVGSSGFTIKKPKNKTRPRRVESDEDDEERERRDSKELRDYEAQSKRSKNRYPPQKPTQLARPRAPEPIKVDESSGDEMALKPDIPDKSYNRVDVNIDFDELPEPVPKSSSSESSSSKSSMLARPKPPRPTPRTKEGQGSTQETVRKRLSSSVSEFIPLGNSKAAARNFDKLPSQSIKTSAGKFKTPEARSSTTKSTAPRSPPVDLTETTPVKCPTKVDKQPVAGSSKKNKAVPKSPPFLSTAKPKSKMKKAPQAQQFPMEIPPKPDSTPSVPRTAQPFPVSQNSQNDENSPPPRTSPKRKRGEPYGTSNKHAKKPSNPVELLAMEKSSKASASKPDRVAEAWKLSPRRPNLPDLSDSDRDVSIEPEFSFTQIVGARHDPNTLCPFCDEVMPEQPSAHLLHLIKLARKRARPDPRHTNSLGLRAPITSYVDVCTRHEFEKVQVPRAQAKGWPAHIDFDGLPARVQTLKSDLDRISLNPSSSSFYSELKSDIDKKGKASVTSAGAQFALFERSQPGYYGERGSSIIHHCLLATYPPSSFDLDIIFPLTSTEFTQNVLLPETATRLIMDDMDADYEDAIKTLRASGKYGVTMFPSLEVDDVVDKILASDTRERLFNQEDEDWVDPDAKEAKRQKTEEKVKGKGKAKAKSNRMDTSSPPPMSDDRPRPVPRPRPVQRGKPATEMKSTPLAAVSETDSEDSSSDSELELPAAMRMQKPTAIVPAVAPKLKYMDIDWD